MRFSLVSSIVIAGVVVAALSSAPAWARGPLEDHPGTSGSHSFRETHGFKPPGWSHGEKVGWDHKLLPPGLARH